MKDSKKYATKADLKKLEKKDKREDKKMMKSYGTKQNKKKR